MKEKLIKIFLPSISIILVGAIVFLVYGAVKWYKLTPEIERINIKDAAKIGEKKTVQLLIQISDSEVGEGNLERGDVVLSASEDRKFSIAEQEGFLIIKVKLTKSEQQLMSLSLNEKPSFFGKHDEKEKMTSKMIKRRKFAVDLAKIGISPEQKIGKIISDKIFEDDVLIEKK